jgi:hypothetical protein
VKKYQNRKDIMQNGWKYILSLAALIASMSMMVEAVQPAYALNGPNISMGSNPVDSNYFNCASQTDGTVFTNTASSDFVITDVILYNGAARLNIGTETGSPTEFIGGYASYGYDQRFHFGSGIVVPAGSTLYCTAVNAYPEVTVSGYYAH